MVSRIQSICHASPYCRQALQVYGQLSALWNFESAETSTFNSLTLCLDGRSSALRVHLVGYEPDLERVCAAAMRSCYSPHPGYELFTYTGNDKVLEGEKVFDQERVASLLKRALELGHYDILEHNSITWLAEAGEEDIFSLLDSSKFFETTRLDEERWLITTNLRVLVELARGNNQTPLAKELIGSLQTAAPNVAAVLTSPGPEVKA